MPIVTGVPPAVKLSNTVLGVLLNATVTAPVNENSDASAGLRLTDAVSWPAMPVLVMRIAPLDTVAVTKVVVPLPRLSTRSETAM